MKTLGASGKNKIELLAPAQDLECFKAAIHAGADAVYAGGAKFGARAYAKNFSTDELLYAIDYAHLYGRKLYLTANTVIKNEETESLYDQILPLYERGIDGVIVQDMGVIKLLHKWFPDLVLHASTQMSVTGKEGAMLLKDIGIKRIVPARELSLEELEVIHRETGMELECFIHGALCYSYSGKCLFSSIVGGRSGNRGRCAQPCRLPYNGSYILSARDIMTLELLPKLIDAGITSFKIEGRMKPKEYVAPVTGIYRKYIDKIIGKDKGEYRVSKEDLRMLDALYTRSGHCRGYYEQHNGKDMITVEKPSYDSADTDITDAANERYLDREERIGISGKITARAGEELKISLSCGDFSAEYTGELIETAKTRPTLRNDIIKQMQKTGDTVFEFDEINVTADEDIFIPVSVLNHARREAIELLKDNMLKSHIRTKAQSFDTADRPFDRCDNERVTDRQTKVNCFTDDPSMIGTVLRYGYVDRVTVNAGSFTDINDIYRVSEIVHEKGRELFVAFPAVIRNGCFERHKDLKDLILSGNIDGVVTDNTEGLYYIRDIGYEGSVLSDIHLYVMNDAAAAMLKAAGADMITYSPELSAKELAGLNISFGEYMLYGRYPMMITAQCVEKTINKCLKDNGVTYISDRYRNEFPCVRNCGECFNTILNCHPALIIPKDLPAGFVPYSYRLHFTTEDEREVKDVLSFYERIFKGEVLKKPDIKYTLGHLKRGVE